MNVNQEILGREVDVEKWVGRAAGLVLFYVLWTWIASTFPENLMPDPLETVTIALELAREGLIATHFAATFSRVLAAFVVAMILGVSAGVLMGSTKFFRDFMTPYVMFTLSLPGVAVVLVNILIFGFSEITVVLTAVAIVFPYVVINTMEGVENIDYDLVTMSNSFEISRGRLLRRMILPNVAPSLFSSVRFAISIGWRLVVVAEAFGSGTGVGYKLLQTFDAYRFEESFAWALVFMLAIILIEYGIFKPLERRVFDYRENVGFAVAG